MLEFCPMCRNLLMMKEENGKNVGFCRCGFRRTGGITISGEEKNNETSRLGSGFIDDVKDLTGGFFRICAKCGFDRAEADSIASNESEITIFTCLKCGHKERQAQGSSKA